MRSGLAIVVFSIWIVLFGTGASADDAQLAKDLTAARAMLDTAFQDNDVETIKSMVTPDHVGVTSYYQGSMSTEKEIATLSEFKGKYFDFSEAKVDVLGSDAAMITFENSLSGTYNGKPLPSRVFVLEIWIRDSGKWLQKYYQETPIAE